jgi:hypothetical protein
VSVLQQAHRIGAVFYVLWGIFHAGIGLFLLYQVLGAGGPAALLTIGSALPAASIPTQDNALVDGVLEHYAWNLVWFGAYAIAVAVSLNWRNSRVGYWFNLVLVSLTDLGFIGAIVVPGYIDPLSGWSGPALWVLAVGFTTLGLRTAPPAGG